MVGKLLKYEAKAYFRRLFPFQLIALEIAVLARCVQFFENESEIYTTVIVSSVLMAVVACIFLSFFTLWSVVSRFYNNLFKREGYLSFTLPVSTAQHIFAKLLAAVAVLLISSAIEILSFLILSSGDLLYEVSKAASFLFGKFTELVGVHAYIFIAEAVLLILISVVKSVLVFYTCATVGQLSNKNRGLLSVGIFFGYYVVCQIISTAVTSVISSAFFLGALDGILEFIENNVIASVHIAFAAAILFDAVFATVYFFITHAVIGKKLNLE